jgi:Big-like domain-containing protein
MRTYVAGLVAAGLFSYATAAAAEPAEKVRPRGTRILIPALAEKAGTAAGPAPSSRIIYLDRCKDTGCTLYGNAEDDSRTDQSSIVGFGGLSQVHMEPLSFTDAQWQTVVDCVRDMYGDFNVQITDIDPGDVPHWRHVVAGRPQDVGMQDGVGGVSPWTGLCYPQGIIDNSITFTFAEVYGSSPDALQSVCETVAQETAHSLALDHSFHCPDPMTYLFGCGPKKFRDLNVRCGEYSERNCCDDPSIPTQNSYASMMDFFGPYVPSPPTVTITDPADGAEVLLGFTVTATIEDIEGIASAQLYIDGASVATKTAPPWTFNAPMTLGTGVHTIEVRAIDNRDTVGSASASITLGEPCDGADDCDDGQVCVSGRCVLGPGNNGGLGEPCTVGTECASGLCPRNDGTGEQHCAEICPLETGFCPGGFDCLPAGNGSDGVCWPNDGEGGGCCSTSTPSTATLLGQIALALFALFALSRRILPRRR